MKILIIPLSVDGYLKNSASERFRCDWLLPYLEADKYDGSQNLNNYEVIIYQKAYTSPWVRQLAAERKGKCLQIWDVTDPEWVYRAKLAKEMIDSIDVITVSTTALKRSIKKVTNKPVYIIPHRHELSFYKEKKVHRNILKPALVWFGYACNFARVIPLLPYINSKHYNLTAICEQPVHWKTYRPDFIPWGLHTVNKDIIRGDIVLNPLDDEGYVSNNKSVFSWLLGMPVAETIEDIERFKDYNERVKESEKRMKEARKKYDIRHSAKELESIIRKGTQSLS